MFTIQYLNGNTGEWQNFRDLPAYDCSIEAGKVAWSFTDKLACKFRIVTASGKVVSEVN